MTRIAVAIIVTVVVLGGLVVLAGRTNWYAVSYRLTSDAIDAVSDNESAASLVPASFPTISDPAAWNQDFMRGARASAACPTDTVGNIRTRIAAVGPYAVDDFERTIASLESADGAPGENGPAYNRVSELVRRSLRATDRIYVFGFRPGTPDSGNLRVSGYFVARDECIVHVEITGIGE